MILSVVKCQPILAAKVRIAAVINDPFTFSGLNCCNVGYECLKFASCSSLGNINSDNTAAVLLDHRIDDFAAQHPQPFERTLLIHTHQPRVAHDIGR